MKNSSKPNILIFIPDEMRGEVLTNPSIKMPNMRGIVDDGGVIFTQNFSVNPVCAPSRICTFTGQYPHNGGHRSLYQLLRPGEENLFHILKENGYDVIWIGRNDLFQKSAIKENVTKRIGGMLKDLAKPLIKEGIKRYGLFRMIRIGLNLRKKGFKEMAGIPEISHLLEIVMGKRPFNKDSKWYNSFYFGKIAEEKSGKSSDDQLIQHALEYLDEVKHKSKNRKPFCLFVPIAYPHPPYEVEDPYFSMYDRSKIEPPYPLVFPDSADRKKKPKYSTILHETYRLNEFSENELREILAVYYGMCKKVDDQYGQIIEKLKDINLYDNTLVSVFADHGDYAGNQGLVEKWPTGMEDSLLNVPLLLKLPRERAAISKTDTLTQTIDIFPTILEVAGINHPYTHFGKSLIPVIKGENDTHRDVIFAEGGYDLEREPQAFEDVGNSPHDPGIGIYYHKARIQLDQPETVCRTSTIRTKKWKMTLRTHPEAVEELYDLENDPSEVYNLFGEPEHESIIADLKERLLRWYLETSDNPHYEHKREP